VDLTGLFFFWSRFDVSLRCYLTMNIHVVLDRDEVYRFPCGGGALAEIGKLFTSIACGYTAVPQQQQFFPMVRFRYADSYGCCFVTSTAGAPRSQ
jgi:hypothetical protein